MELFQWIFYGPAKLLAAWPYAGIAIAACLIAAQLWLHLRDRRRFSLQFFREAAVFAGVLWLVFNAYELQVSAIAAREGGSFLRIDLMVLIPILYVMTAAGLLSIFRQRKPSQPEKDKQNL
jgi:preprotein translocase subunit Sec61beta